MSEPGLPPVSVYGGAGGQRAVTEDLEQSAAVLARAAHEVNDAGKAVSKLVHCCEDAHPRALPEVAPYVWDAKDAASEAVHGIHGVVRLEAAIEDTAARLRTIAHEFLAAEAAAHQRLTELASMGRGVGDVAAAWAWWARTSTGTLVRMAGPEWLAEAIDPEYALPTSGVVNRTTVEANLASLRARGIYEPLRMALVAAARVAEVLLGEAPHAAVDAAQVSDPDPLTSLADVGTMLETLDATHPREVAVDRLVDHDGAVSWIVTVPGMAAVLGGGKEEIDGVAAAEMTDGSMSDATDLVLSAMAAAGIAPGEAVMIAGHSAGGMVAAALAASAHSPYAIRAVVTAGSPVGDVPRNPAVSYVHVENAPDPVPGLDGRRNPDLPNVVTGVFDSRTSTDAGLAAHSRTIIGAHEAKTYTQGLALLDSNTSASMQAAREATAPFFAPAASVERTVVSQVQGPAADPVPTRAGPPVANASPASGGMARISLGGIPELRP